jgi:hypothetical protein
MHWLAGGASLNTGLKRPLRVASILIGYSRRELRDIERIIREHLETLRHEGDAFCSGDTHPA